VADLFVLNPPTSLKNYWWPPMNTDEHGSTEPRLTEFAWLFLGHYN